MPSKSFPPGWYKEAGTAHWAPEDQLETARTSLVAFANLSENPDFTPLIMNSSTILIRRDERFAKTAVGWLLREEGKHQKEIAVKFILDHRRDLTREVFNNSVKNFDKSEKSKLRKRVFEDG